jgi:hypothetical protein
VNYHGRIMNISTFLVPDEGYRIGHRDARHAAAEIANEADAEIERLRGLLRDVRSEVAMPLALDTRIYNAIMGIADQPDVIAWCARCQSRHELGPCSTPDQQSPCPQCGMTEPTMCRRLDCKLNWGGLYPVAADPKSGEQA